MAISPNHKSLKNVSVMFGKLKEGSTPKAGLCFYPCSKKTQMLERLFSFTCIIIYFFSTIWSSSTCVTLFNCLHTFFFPSTNILPKWQTFLTLNCRTPWKPAFLSLVQYCKSSMHCLLGAVILLMLWEHDCYKTRVYLRKTLLQLAKIKKNKK